MICQNVTGDMVTVYNSVPCPQAVRLWDSRALEGPRPMLGQR